MQYCHARGYAEKKTNCGFLKAPAMKHYWKCTGVKACELLHPRIRSLEHTVVDQELWDIIQNVSSEIQESVYKDQRVKNAFS
jgi:hypothetical protein